MAVDPRGWLYLAVIIDLFSRQEVGWAMSERIDRKLALDALRMALAQRRPPRGGPVPKRARRFLKISNDSIIAGGAIHRSTISARSNLNAATIRGWPLNPTQRVRCWSRSSL